MADVVYFGSILKWQFIYWARFFSYENDDILFKQNHESSIRKASRLTVMIIN